MIVDRPVLSSRHYLLATAAFALFVIYGSYVPLTTRSLDWSTAVDRFAAIMSRQPKIESKSDWAANVILFVPLGFLAAGAIGVDRKRPVEQLALIPAMSAFSAAVEFGQLWFPDRNTSINDIVAESMGGAIGVCTWFMFGQEFTNRFRAAWAKLGPGDWAAKALPAYLLFLVIVHGMPFDLTLSPWQIKKKYDNGREIDAEATGTPQIALAPRSSQAGEKTLQNITYFIPVGALFALLPGARWRSKDAANRVFGYGFAIALGIEAIQLIVVSCGTYASDVVCGSLLVLLGWWLVVRPHSLSPEAWIGVALAWSLALTVVLWMPFDLDTSRADRFEWIPFKDYYASNYIAAFNRVINKSVIFAPLGFAIRRGLQGPGWSTWAVGGAVSAVIEVGQTFFTEHSTSISDVGLGAVGAGVGGLIASRVLAITARPSADPAPRQIVFYS